ncbi:MAG TPA: YggS family pyridoxal phosphate-dependent enzyme [Peptococcaceae bacterium]|nr:YggS family pyridoxal phosphate-dependent enzyme [Peptococcaceae bacterium]
MDIQYNIITIKEKIKAAAERAGRQNEKIEIVAVTKTVSPERIQEAYQAGLKNFGENRVQEWQQKKDFLPADCKWHIIGRLQTNKVKYLDKSVVLIHSLDRFSLLEKLQAEGEKRQIIWQTLVQVNVAQDEAKAGLAVEEVKDFVETVKSYSHVRVLGLMTIGALDASPEETRGFFRQLREIKEELIRKGISQREELPHLSMGMSQDYELAVEEGATLVRIGSSIFGHRN